MNARRLVASRAHPQLLHATGHRPTTRPLPPRHAALCCEGPGGPLKGCGSLRPDPRRSPCTPPWQAPSAEECEAWLARLLEAAHPTPSSLRRLTLDDLRERCERCGLRVPRRRDETRPISSLEILNEQELLVPQLLERVLSRHDNIGIRTGSMSIRTGSMSGSLSGIPASLEAGGEGLHANSAKGERTTRRGGSDASADSDIAASISCLSTVASLRPRGNTRRLTRDPQFDAALPLGGSAGA